MLQSDILQAHSLLTCLPILQFYRHFSLPRKSVKFSNKRSLSPLRWNGFAQSRLSGLPNHNFKAVRGLMLDGGLLEVEDVCLLMETCITRTLPPALTLERGLEKITEAVDELKSNPPCSASGMYRFLVAVSPSAKALKWFCCQPESSDVFPQFFISKDKEDSTHKSLSLNGSRGVFGIGAAVYFQGSASDALTTWSSFKRFLSGDATVIMAYGFMDIMFDVKSSFPKHDIGSFCIFIPQIQLDESEGISILSATLAWNDSSLYTFEYAVQSYELALSQASRHFWPTIEKCYNKCIRSALTKFNVVQDNKSQMVCMNAFLLEGRDPEADAMKLKNGSFASQFVIRFSPKMAIANSMVDHGSEKSYSLQENANINTLWASLIIEECSRLGLTYFCVAPGSRSSPLAIAASTHPLTTCIVCFDERSLAFHAVGFARGSHKPAIVITSSGTAVSNLFPAVVEASQDFVPLLLLTADRPPELQDAGANQTINQVNHFGSFVRFFYSLPPPDDNIPARMVLTTIDSALYWATSSPCGPVHINCPFREPLESSERKWMLSCLKGLDFWLSSAEPFTNYIQVHHSYTCENCQGEMAEVLKIIQEANRGFLLIGEIHSEDDIWAVLLLAKHLLWPVVADILSGLRLRKYLTSYPDIEENFLFVDHLDHSLLSNMVRSWAQADVIVQIGSRITSKRIYQMIEDCFPCSYIMVDKHPNRHDPSHIVTHRIHSTITKFTDCLLKAEVAPVDSRWSCILRALDMMVAWEISFLIHSDYSLTEPYVAHIIPQTLQRDSALFVGNSMAIRDADMYGCNWSKATYSVGRFLSAQLPCQGILVVGNRGASGIDGLLSTAVGFSMGCNKKVLCVLGDVSFLHDTNGLALLKQRMSRKPMTVIVINNHGGAIFSLLPIAERVEQSVLKQFFYTSHNISIRNLCLAHGLKHVLAQTKMELKDALFASQHAEVDCIIEVESCIEANSTFHSNLRKYSCQAADHALSVLSSLSISESNSHGFIFSKISKMEYSLYRVQLHAPPTSTSINYESASFCRVGFVLSLFLEDGTVGLGEVAPLEIHRESIIDVEEQLRFLIHVIEGAKISCLLPLLRGSFSTWMWSVLGISPGSIFPSVRCGLEMAVLNAMAAREGSTLLDVLHPLKDKAAVSESSLNVPICALIDSNGTPIEVAYIATTLVEEGFNALKLKVARQADPIKDALVVQEVRKTVGDQIELRVDANQRWTYEEATQFGSYVKNCNLQYIEEPVKYEDDIIKFCDETGLPVALDETIDNIQEQYPLDNFLAKYTHSGIVAIVIKPSVVGGFETAALIARWALQQGKMTVVSAAFESSLGLSTYIQFSSYLVLQNTNLYRLMNKERAPPIAHGLGTYRWLKEDITTEPLNISRNPDSGFMEASVLDADRVLKKFQINHSAILRTFTGERVCKYQLKIASNGFSFSVNVQEIGQSVDNNVLLFLHGFLGTGEEWIPIMKAISGSTRCIAIDLPGHGQSTMQKHAHMESEKEPSLSIDVVSDILSKVIHCIAPGGVILVGYSMGARIALYMALRCCNKVEGAVLISGSPGLQDVGARKIRWAKDDSRACFLIAHGLKLFLDIWYAGELWDSLRSHPHFRQIVASRLLHYDVNNLAKSLSDLSLGRQPSLWEDLKHCKVPLLLIVGERDRKFRRIAQEMGNVINLDMGHMNDTENKTCEIVEVPHCGHAAHLESPLHVITAVRQFLKRWEFNGQPKVNA